MVVRHGVAADKAHEEGLVVLVQRTQRVVPEEVQPGRVVPSRDLLALRHHPAELLHDREDHGGITRRARREALLRDQSREVPRRHAAALRAEERLTDIGESRLDRTTGTNLIRRHPRGRQEGDRGVALSVEAPSSLEVGLEHDGLLCVVGESLQLIAVRDVHEVLTSIHSTCPISESVLQLRTKFSRGCPNLVSRDKN